MKRLERIYTGEKPFSCSKCEKRFRQSSDLKSHERVHNDEKPFSRSKCDKKFITSKILRTHERIHKGDNHTAAQNVTKINMAQHLKSQERIRTGEKPFNCLKCEK